MVRLKPYSEADLHLLIQNNSPEMTAQVGGPESEEKINQRHQRYLELPQAGTAQMYVVWVKESESADIGVGIVGYWEKEWQGEMVWEAGWGILPEYQGRGALPGRPLPHSSPKRGQRSAIAFSTPTRLWAGNPPSNALCRKLGFDLIEECDFEYPPGHMMRCNDWRLDLSAEPAMSLLKVSV